MVDLSLLQSMSYIAGALGVCVAAIYYIMMLRNTEKIRRRDLIFQKLQVPLEFYEAYYPALRNRDWNSIEEFREKHILKESGLMPKVSYLLNHFNALGMLYQEGLATPEQIFQQYVPLSIITIFEKYKGLIVLDRLTPSMEVHNPNAFKGFELLYNEAKRLYPKSPRGPFTREVLLEHARKVDDLLKSGAPLP
jgi:hypothetical protein